MEINYKDLGERIQRKREEMGLTQQNLAERAKTSTQHLSNVENAKTKVSLQKFVDIAYALAITPNDLLCGTLWDNKEIYQTEIANIIEQFSPEELRMVPEILRAFDITFKAGQNSSRNE